MLVITARPMLLALSRRLLFFLLLSVYELVSWVVLMDRFTRIPPWSDTASVSPSVISEPAFCFLFHYFHWFSLNLLFLGSNLMNSEFVVACQVRLMGPSLLLLGLIWAF